MTGFIAGFTLGLSLILVIGSQNAFLLRQGLKQEHVLTICLICSISDALLIISGVAGFSVILLRTPWIETAARYAGALFLMGYGARSFWMTFKAENFLKPSADRNGSLALAITTCLALTWLNPHVYLDTVILLGSVSTQFPGQKVEFTSGAVLASFLFFHALGFGARVLTPLLNKPASWRMLDFAIGLIMWSIAISLVKEHIQAFFDR